MTTDHVIDTARVEPMTAPVVGRLCAEVDRILTAAYARMVADAVATRRIAVIRTTTTRTAAPHASHAPDARVGGAPTSPWRGVYANQRAPPAQSGAEQLSSTTRHEGGDPTTNRSSTHPNIEPAPLPHRDTLRRTRTHHSSRTGTAHRHPTWQVLGVGVTLASIGRCTRTWLIGPDDIDTTHRRSVARRLDP